VAAAESASAEPTSVGCGLTKREEEEPGGGSEKGLAAYGPVPVMGCEELAVGEGDGGAECEGLATISSSRTLSSDV